MVHILIVMNCLVVEHCGLQPNTSVWLPYGPPHCLAAIYIKCIAVGHTDFIIVCNTICLAVYDAKYLVVDHTDHLSVCQTKCMVLYHAKYWGVSQSTFIAVGLCGRQWMSVLVTFSVCC